MKLTAAEKRAVQKALKSIDTQRLLDGLGRSSTRSGGFSLLQQALQTVGCDLAPVYGALNGDSGRIALTLERDGVAIENASVPYAWHLMEGSERYEITAYLA